jgi:hypothetical protein
MQPLCRHLAHGDPVMIEHRACPQVFLGDDGVRHFLGGTTFDFSGTLLQVMHGEQRSGDAEYQGDPEHDAVARGPGRGGEQGHDAASHRKGKCGQKALERRTDRSGEQHQQGRLSVPAQGEEADRQCQQHDVLDHDLARLPCRLRRVWVLGHDDHRAFAA